MGWLKMSHGFAGLLKGQEGDSKIDGIDRSENQKYNGRLQGKSQKSRAQLSG